MIKDKLAGFKRLRNIKKQKLRIAKELLEQKINDQDFNNDTPTIIVCLDINNASNVVLKYACYQARRNGFGVQILSVIENSHKDLLFVSRTIAKEKRQSLEQHLNKLIDEAYKETGVIASISIKEGDIITAIIDEMKSTPNCVMLIFGKAQDSSSDNTILPKISKQIGSKINIPMVIVPQNLTNQYLQKL
jgi:hypothetical protein